MKKLLLLLVLGSLLSSPLFSQCLADKYAGSNPADLANLANDYNNPSSYTFGSMLGINDAGQFQGIGSSTNPISYLTKKMRAFHAMDYDFYPNLQFGTPYSQLTKPKDTNGYPVDIANNSGNYINFVGGQGLNSISAATEILNRDPLSWKEKIWNESDWWPSTPGMSVTDGIRQSYQIYTDAFIQEHESEVDFYQVGNELWDYPFEEDYHAMLEGAHAAFVAQYGSNSSNWTMKFMPGSFQADDLNNTCSSQLRDFSNCGNGLERFDQIGDYLDVSNCAILSDMHAINVHAYPFDDAVGGLNYVHPEKANNELLSFRAALAFRDSNPILANKGIWLTETGYDSHPTNNGSGNAAGVGSKTQAAYLLRLFMLTGRYHLERVDLYMGFDLTRSNNIYHGDLYASSGLWSLGVHPQYGYPSAVPAHGAKPKPSFFALSDFQNKFENKVFREAVSETSTVHAHIIANPDGSDPYLVFWSPTATTDNNLFSSIAVSKSVNLPAGYKVNSTTATLFASTGNENTAPYGPYTGATFTGVSGTNTGNTTITSVRRMPAYIPLTTGTGGCSGGGGGSTQASGCGVTVSINGLTVSFVSSSNTGNQIIKVRNSSWSVQEELCNTYTSNACNSSASISVPSAGAYIVDVQNGGGCTFPITVTTGGGGGPVDNDMDGVCSDVDCDDDDASVGAQQTPGTACDDGDPSTGDDEIQADGCTCEGDTTTPPCSTISDNCSNATVELCGSTVRVTLSNNSAYQITINDVTSGWAVEETLCADWTSSDKCLTGVHEFTLPDNHIYSVQVTLDGSGSCSSSQFSVSGARVNNSGKNTLTELSVYPNPVNGRLNILTDNDTNIESLSVFTTTGIQLLEKHDELSFIDLQGLPTGVYFISFKTDKGLITKRVVKN